jgi:hypothetical protein
MRSFQCKEKWKPDGTYQEKIMDSAPETQPELKPQRSDTMEPRPHPQPDLAFRRKPSYPEDPRFKSPILATFLSVVPGLGQVYTGYYRQGFINIIVVGSLIAILSGPEENIRGLMPLLVFFLVFFWLFNLVDSYRRASFYNQALSGIPVTELPQDFKLPEQHGSLLIGSLLILAGLVIASHTVFGYSLEWLQRWWPIALILVGAYLVIQAIRDRKSKS